MTVLASLFTNLFIAVLLLVAAAMGIVFALFYFRARLREGQPLPFGAGDEAALPAAEAASGGSAAGLAALRQEVNALAERSEWSTSTAQQEVAQRLEEIRQQVTAQGHQITGLQHEVRHEGQRRDAELQEIRQQLTHAIETFWDDAPAALAQAQTPRLALDGPSATLDADESALGAPEADAPAHDMTAQPPAFEPIEASPAPAFAPIEPDSFEPDSLSFEAQGPEELAPSPGAFDAPEPEVADAQPPAFEAPAFEAPAFEMPAFEAPADEAPAFQPSGVEAPAWASLDADTPHELAEQPAPHFDAASGAASNETPADAEHAPAEPVTDTPRWLPEDTFAPSADATTEPAATPEPPASQPVEAAPDSLSAPPAEEAIPEPVLSIDPAPQESGTEEALFQDPFGSGDSIMGDYYDPDLNASPEEAFGPAADHDSTPGAFSFEGGITLDSGEATAPAPDPFAGSWASSDIPSDPFPAPQEPEAVPEPAFDLGAQGFDFDNGFAMSAEGEPSADPFAAAPDAAPEADAPAEPLNPSEFTFLSGPGARSGNPFAPPAPPEAPSPDAPPAPPEPVEQSERATPADEFGFVSVDSVADQPEDAEEFVFFTPPPAEPPSAPAEQAPAVPAASAPPDEAPAPFDPFATASPQDAPQDANPAFAPVDFYDPTPSAPEEAPAPAPAPAAFTQTHAPAQPAPPQPPAPMQSAPAPAAPAPAQPEPPTFASADSFLDEGTPNSGDGAHGEEAAAPEPSAPASGDDSLQAISSIDASMQAQLNELGVTTLDEIARWSRADARNYAGRLQVSEQEIMNRWIFEAQSALFERYQQEMRQG